MFGFSVPKLLLLAIIVWGVFAITRLFRRPPAPAPTPEASRSGPVARRGASDAEELVRCERCGTFVAQTGARSCGRPDCKFG